MLINKYVHDLRSHLKNVLFDSFPLYKVYPFWPSEFLYLHKSINLILSWLQNFTWLMLINKYVISVKKELNRLCILGTLITWFASYLAKSSQILKNYSIMLFTSNTNSLQENTRLDTLEARKHEKMQRTTNSAYFSQNRQKYQFTRHGE